MKKLPKCSIIVLNYNGKDLLDDCFTSLRKLNYPKKQHEIIMVDNGSTDGSINYAKSKYPWLKIVKLDKNYGFSEGNDKGIHHAKGDYIIFLNNDTKVERNWLIELVKVAMSSDKIAICGSKMINQHNNGIISLGGRGKLNFWGIPKIDTPTNLKGFIEAFWVPGGALLIKKSVLNKLEYCFDPSYFAYFEEHDLCWRVRLLGYSVIYVPTSVVHHKYKATASKFGDLLDFYHYRNKIFTYRKNLRFPLDLLSLSFIFLTIFLTMVYRGLTGKWKYGIYVMKFFFTKSKKTLGLNNISLKKQIAVFNV